MTVVMRQVTWGEALHIEALKVPRGITAVTEAITAELGPIGVRNTFAKFFAVTDPAAIAPRDRFRAWLVLAALQLDATEWGIGDDAVPPAMNAMRLRRNLAKRLCAARDSNPEPAD